MPLYEYHCKRCGKTFEVRQKFSDGPLATHEDCGGDVERLISPPAFQFKGSGWYVTDYGKNNSPAPSANSNGKSEAKSESKTETKTETKSETPSAPKASAPEA